jgi:ribosome modulation factor
MSACTGFRANVSGRSKDIDAAGPNPGRTPTKVPMRHPQKHKNKLMGSRAILKDRSR